jgi:hypothetical protein
VPPKLVERVSESAGADKEPPFTIAVGLSYLLGKAKVPEYVREMFKDKLHPDTLDILDQHYSDDYIPLLQNVERCVKEESVASLNNAAALINVHERCWHSNDSVRDQIYWQNIFGLQWHHGIKEKDFSATDTDREIGEALVVAGSALGQPYSVMYANGVASMYYMPSRQLVNLISERPKEVDAIVALLESRRLPAFSDKDIEVIRELLDGASASPLGNGVL